MGKNKKIFEIYKIRTMVEDAENQKSKIKDQNEADYPAFKIHNDPRYTKLGKFLAHTALDEIPQLINIVKGEMAFVGPRPLPVGEAKKVPAKYKKRFSVRPGMTSDWIIKGADHTSFEKWMMLDLDYVKNKSIWRDLIILLKTAGMILKMLTNCL